jgi:integrase
MGKQWIADKRVPGLGVMVLPSGVRTWYLRYREPGGKQQTHKIGRADSVNVTTAREEAHKILAAVAKGDAPTSARQQLRRSPTVAQLLERIKREHWRKLRPGTVVNNELIWRLHLLPEFGATKVVDLQRRQVVAWFHEHSDKRPVRANRCLEVLSKAMSLAELWELRPQGTNPCQGVQSNREGKRKRYISREELERMTAALDAFATAGVRWRFAQLVRLLLLTGCRINELMAAPWRWLDDDATVLTLPPEAHKTGGDGNERKVHLPPAASLILRELRRRSNSEWIIAGDGDGHLVGYWRMWADLLEDASIQNLRIHDLRHSYASYAITTAGLTLPQVGALLGHASPQTTARYAHLMDEAAAAMAAKVASAITQQKAPAV